MCLFNFYQIRPKSPAPQRPPALTVPRTLILPQFPLPPPPPCRAVPSFQEGTRITTHSPHPPQWASLLQLKQRAFPAVPRAEPQTPVLPGLIPNQTPTPCRPAHPTFLLPGSFCPRTSPPSLLWCRGNSPVRGSGETPLSGPLCPSGLGFRATTRVSQAGDTHSQAPASTRLALGPLPASP